MLFGKLFGFCLLDELSNEHKLFLPFGFGHSVTAFNVSDYAIVDRVPHLVLILGVVGCSPHAMILATSRIMSLPTISWCSTWWLGLCWAHP